MKYVNIKKVLFFFAFGLIIFLINNVNIYALDREANFLCQYHVDGYGTIVFYRKPATATNPHQVSVTYELTPEQGASGCGSQEHPCTAVDVHKTLGDSLLSAWKFKFRNDNTTYTCPKLYYKVNTGSNAEGTVWTKSVTISPIDEGGFSVAAGRSDFEGNEVDTAAPNEKCSDDGIKQYRAYYSEQYKSLRQKYSDKYDEMVRNAHNDTSHIYTNQNNQSFFQNLYSTTLANIEDYVINLGCNPQTLENDEKELKKLFDTWLKKYDNKVTELVCSDIDQYGELEDNQCENAKKEVENNEKEANKNATESSNMFYEWQKREIGEEQAKDKCEGILGTNVKEDIKEILSWVRIAAPILVIILGTLDFSKAVISNDDKALSKAVSRFVIRLIIAVALVFVPTILNFVINAIDALAGGCSMGDLL